MYQKIIKWPIVLYWWCDIDHSCDDGAMTAMTAMTALLSVSSFMSSLVYFSSMDKLRFADRMTRTYGLASRVNEARRGQAAVGEDRRPMCDRQSTHDCASQWTKWTKIVSYGKTILMRSWKKSISDCDSLQCGVKTSYWARQSSLKSCIQAQSSEWEKWFSSHQTYLNSGS